jgi:SAM-dependent methyltransferase
VSGQVPATYDAQTLEATEDFVNYNGWVIDKVADAVRGRTLEFGAGSGTMSALLEPHCSELVLIEPAPNLADALETRFADKPHVSTHSGLLEHVVSAHEADFVGSFDTVISFNVLEHIDDHVATLQLARSLLRPQGRVVLFVPALPVLYGTIDAQVDHIRRYTKRSLRDAIGAAGMTVERIEYLDFLGMVPWFLVGRVLRKTTEGGGVRGYDRFVIPICRTFDRIIGPPVGKNLIAVAHANG